MELVSYFVIYNVLVMNFLDYKNLFFFRKRKPTFETTQMTKFGWFQQLEGSQSPIL